MSNLHVIYLPGLGDHRAGGQELAVGLWRLYGVESEMYRLLWHNQQSFDDKLHALLSHIDKLLAAGKTVALVAASAGASAALQVFAARREQIAGVVLLCGKVYNPQHMRASVTQHNLSFGQAMATLPTALAALQPAQRQRILSVHPLADESVPIADTRIPGSQERTMPVIGHVAGIAFGLTIYAPVILHFLKTKAGSLKT